MEALVAMGITNYALWIVRNTRSALFTKDGCTVCKAAMKILKRLGRSIGLTDKDVTVIDLEKRTDKEKIMKELEMLTGKSHQTATIVPPTCHFCATTAPPKYHYYCEMLQCHFGSIFC